MAQWKFQLLPSERDVISSGYKMDDIGRDIEAEVNDALPYRFKFHKIGKIVIYLGKNDTEKDYSEQLNVALKQYINISLSEYAKSKPEIKTIILHQAINETFDWFLSEFDDAQFLEIAKSKLNWLC